MKAILNLFKESYYTMPFMMVCQIICAVVCNQQKQKFTELKKFHLYPIASLSQSIWALISVSCFNTKMAVRSMDISVDIFVLLEVSFFYTLFLNLIIEKRLKLVLTISLFSWLLYVIAVFITTGELYWNSMKIITGETVIIFVWVCVYFAHLFKTPPLETVSNQPGFWIIIGILFAFGCTLPNMVLAFFALGLVNDSFYYVINFIGYSVLFLFVIKGYLCKKVDVFSELRNYSMGEG